MKRNIFNKWAFYTVKNKEKFFTEDSVIEFDGHIYKANITIIYLTIWKSVFYNYHAS